jgi:hypothetical protein
MENGMDSDAANKDAACHDFSCTLFGKILI